MEFVALFFVVLSFTASAEYSQTYVPYYPSARPVVQVYQDNCWAATTEAITGIPQTYLTDRVRGHSEVKSLGRQDIGEFRQVLHENGYASGFRILPTPLYLNRHLNRGEMLMVDVRTGVRHQLHSVAVEHAGYGPLGIRRFVTVTDPDDGSRITQPLRQFQRQNQPASAMWIAPYR